MAAAQPDPVTAAGGSRHGDNEDVRKAKDHLRGLHASPETLFALAMRLKKQSRFGYARKLIGRARRERIDEPELRTKYRQQHALCTYKDRDLPADSRHRLALEILEDGEDLRTTRDPETLGIAGAICKRMWEADSQKDNLERSLSYYYRGYLNGVEHDQGYTGINAAFVMDLLAGLEERQASEAGGWSDSARQRRERAREIRERLLEVLPSLPSREGKAWLRTAWRFHATIVEAQFGLGRYADALQSIRTGLAEAREIDDWELDSTMMQLASIVHQRMEARDAGTQAQAKAAGIPVLAELIAERARRAGLAVPADTAPARRLAESVTLGKLGLALSGGGFRASFFHLGVLARLAELDLLRRVEVLSCVSGGSIVGAHYYLELRNQLGRFDDAEIERGHYVDLVLRLQQRFLVGVQKNIRMRMFAQAMANLRMIFIPGYTRTLRIGELCERYLYRPTVDEGVRNGWIPAPGSSPAPWWAPWRGRHLYLSDLYIYPRNESARFKPRSDNWRRSAKVPDLILNATCLNTGHNWQFTASWMGEPPGAINTAVDGNDRLRRMYYWEAPPRYTAFRLGHAVAASACVPGMFPPVVLPRLYPGRTVRLVDGGVHDNQGMTGLLEQDCTVAFISDASGQMGVQPDPSAGIVGSALRSNSVLMGRVRTEQYDDLDARRRSGMLRGLVYVHLMQDLDVDPVDWVGCEDPVEASEDARPAHRRGVLTRYGVLKDVQRLIAGIRTDLDSFSEAEAFALMASGYRMADHGVREHLGRFPVDGSDPGVEWPFLAVDDAMVRGSTATRLMTHLRVAGQRFFKVWRLSRPLSIIGVVIAVAALVVTSWAAWEFRTASILTVGTVAGFVLVTALATIVGKTILRIAQFRSTLTKFAAAAALAILGPILVRAHLVIFDALFRRGGRASRVATRATRADPGDSS
ncbi:MAG: patatin-like phospholipase family protein [Gemmatimonadetes bacterium]|nr:patatin-like phospholipase family protein [Gemmatimonadota bacterium]